MTGADLKTFAVTAALSEVERDAIAEHLIEVVLDSGVCVFSEGETSDGLVCVGAGQLLLSSQRVPGHREIGPGETVGALSLVAPGRRAATLQTLSPSCLYRLTRLAYDHLAGVEPRAALRLVESVLRESAELLRGGVEVLHSSRS